jgi:leader peptidase (prepilin peptidase) / N-methyltransferase
MDAGLLIIAAMLTFSIGACIYAMRRELAQSWALSWLALPLVLALTGGFQLLGLPLAAAAALGSVIPICALICEVDRRHFIIPDVLVLALLGLAVGAPLAARGEQALGALIAGGLFWAVRGAFKRLRGFDGLGLGDVKLAAAMGAILGPSLALGAIAVAAGATALILAARKFTAPTLGQNPAPFGIGLSAALAIAVMVEAWR